MCRAAAPVLAVACLLACSQETPEHTPHPAGDSDGMGDTDAPPATLRLAASCPATTCGGDLVGSWSITDVCFTEAEIIGAAQSYCAGVTVDSVQGSATGGLELTASAATLDIAYSMSGTVRVPGSCAAGNCSFVQQLLETYFDSVTCTAGASSSCDCDVTRSGVAQRSGGYTSSGNTLTFNNGPQHEYCVTGNSMSHRQISPAAPGTFTYAR